MADAPRHAPPMFGDIIEGDTATLLMTRGRGGDPFLVIARVGLAQLLPVGSLRWADPRGANREAARSRAVVGAPPVPWTVLASARPVSRAKAARSSFDSRMRFEGPARRARPVVEDPDAAHLHSCV